MFTCTGFFCLFALLFDHYLVSAAQFQEKLLITAPPTPQATHCNRAQILARQQTCPFGQCGASCLSQGAFCCGPAGSLVTSPFWVCDNGACITSVRGTTGIVDCYDPDNPSGTTQSCVDNVPTTTCKPTDRCYTCSIDFPFCRWETYIATSAATLSWFSCVKSKLPDTTFFAATITTNLPTSSPSTGSAIAGNHNTQQVHLSTGAIIGISVGGGLTLVGVTAIIAYWCLRGRDKGDSQRQELSENAIPAPMIQQYPTELDSRMYTRSELNSTTAYSPHSQPTTPFSPPEGYSGNREEFESWRRGVTDNPVAELQARKSGFFEHIPREVNREQHVTRNSWGEGDDREHMSPGTAY